MKLVRLILKDNEFTAIIVSGHSRFLEKRSGWFAGYRHVIFLGIGKLYHRTRAVLPIFRLDKDIKTIIPLFKPVITMKFLKLVLMQDISNGVN